MAYTAKGAVEYARAMLGLGYWYGTYGNAPANEELFREKQKQYKDQYPPEKWTYESFKVQYGQKVHDCAGLAWKGYLMTPQDASNYPMNGAVYNSKYDYSANGMMEKATDKGDISTMPDVAGIIVWKDNHVGIYEGWVNGRQSVIEARGHSYGVVRTRLDERGWKKWFRCPWFDYSDSTPVPAPSGEATIKLPILQKGDKKVEVGIVQLHLRRLGFIGSNNKELAIDDSFGSNTAYAVGCFNKKYGLGEAGVVTEATWRKLMSISYA